jgi:hypothetical protein
MIWVLEVLEVSPIFIDVFTHHSRRYVPQGCHRLPNAILKILIRLTIKIVYFTRFSLSLQPKPKHITIMTTLAQRISETPMAPYAALLRGMTREQKQIVVTYLTESMEEPKTKRQVPAEFKKLRGIVNITEEDMARDEHLAHIMER